MKTGMLWMIGSFHQFLNCLRIFAFFLSFISPLLGAKMAYSEALPALSPNPLAEQWIKEQVDKGEIADLKQQFSDEKDRTIGSAFLKDLLLTSSDNESAKLYGITIRNAVFVEAFELGSAEIQCDLQLVECVFEKSLDFSRASFEKRLSFWGSLFKETADFSTISVGRFADFSSATFQQSANFASANFLFQLSAIGTRFENPTLVAERKQLATPHYEVNFSNIIVGDSARFDGVVCEASINFTSAKIKGKFLAEKAKFNGENNHVNFNGLEAKGIFIRDSIFEGSVDFTRATISLDILANGAQFSNPTKTLNFNGIRIGGKAQFRDCKFAGPVSFVGSKTAGSIDAQRAQFLNSNNGVSFNGAIVGDSIFLRKALFEGPVDFTYADIARNLEAQYVRFNYKNKHEGVQFQNIKVGESALFAGTVFAGPTNFGFAHVKNCIAFDNASFLHNAGSLLFNGMNVGGTAYFRKALFEAPINLEFASFHALDLTDAEFLDEKNSLLLKGMRYQDITFGDKDTDGEKLLKLVGNSEYNGSVYSNLESFFLSQGNQQMADEAYITMKRREYKERLRWISWNCLSKLWSQFLYIFTGYGRRPLFAFLWSGVVVGIGCFVFSKEKMEPHEKAFASRRYYPLFYSLDLFLPFIDLQATKYWRPKGNHVVADVYMRVLTMLGWLFIPIWIAAWTGIIE